MEHLQHFHLSQDPFQNEPDLKFYFDSATHREAQVRVERGLRQNKGVTVLTGEGGTGKTLLARRILESLEEELFEAGLLVMLPGATGADAVLGRFARQLGVEQAATERAALLAQIYERLAIVREDGRHTVLILDDAQTLNRATMAEVAGLLNLDYEDRRLLSLLMVGLPELDVAISHDSSLSQRVDVRVHLQPLDFQNAKAYLKHRLALVGGSPNIFEPAAVQSLFKFGRGRPRLLNTLGDNALFEAYLGGRQQVSPGDVERSAADLGIGPDPGSTYTGLAQAGAAASSCRRAPPAEACGEPSGATPGQSLDPVEAGAGDFGDSSSEPALNLADEVVAPGESSEPEVDLGDLLDSADPVDGELTTLLDSAAQEAEGAGDLDAAVDAAFAEPEPSLDSLMQDSSLDGAGDALPVFQAKQTTAVAEADATCVVLSEEEPAKSGEDAELEDLFVELIDD